MSHGVSVFSGNKNEAPWEIDVSEQQMREQMGKWKSNKSLKTRWCICKIQKVFKNVAAELFTKLGTLIKISYYARKVEQMYLS